MINRRGFLGRLSVLLVPLPFLSNWIRPKERKIVINTDRSFIHDLCSKVSQIMPSGEVLIEVSWIRIGFRTEECSIWEITITLKSVSKYEARRYSRADWPLCLIGPKGVPDGFVGQRNGYGIVSRGVLIAGSV